MSLFAAGTGWLVARLVEVRVRPRVGVPRELRRAFLPPATTAFVIYALGGLYFALIPSVVNEDLHLTDVAIGGAVVGELGTVAVVAILAGRRLRPSPPD